MPDGGAPVPISVRLPADVIEILDRVAAAMERPRSWVILRALRRYLAEEGQEVLDVQAGVEEIERGEGIPFEQVIAELGKRAAEAERRRKAG